MSLLFRANRNNYRTSTPPQVTVHSNWVTPDMPQPLSAVSTVMPDIYREQPSVRKVVEFIARNVARVQILAYTGTPKGMRELMVPDGHNLASLLESPGGNQSLYRLIHDVVCDMMLYDRFLVDYNRYTNTLDRMEPARWSFTADPSSPEKVIGFTANSTQYPLDAVYPDADHGFWWDKGYGSAQGISPMDTLKQTLAEHAESVAWRREIWRNGLRMPGYWTQDLSEAALSPDARHRLQEELANYVANGGKEGQSPILRGIAYNAMPTPFTPQSAQEIEGRTLSDIEVASAFHVPPEMVGARVSTYASQQAFRDALYRETLGPLFVQLQETFNLQICKTFYPGSFIEFNLDSALRGSFVDDAQVTSSAVGGPWLSVNEARKAHGYEPKSAEYDEILTQLNTVRGGGPLASPHDTGTQNLGGHTA